MRLSLRRLKTAWRGWPSRLWGKPGDDGGTPSLRVVRTALLALEAYRNNHLTIYASGLAFFMLLSVGPFLGFILMLLRAFGLADRLRPYLLLFLAGGNETVMSLIAEHVGPAQSGVLGGLGVLVTFFVGFLLLERAKNTLNLIWEVEESQGIRFRLIEYATVLTVTPLLLGAAFGITGFVSSIAALEQIPGPLVIGGLSASLGNLSGFAILFLVLLYAYRYLPDTPVWLWAALPGAVVSTALMVVAQKFYLSTVYAIATYSHAFGALTSLPLLMLWFYLGWLIFMLGAQLTCVIQHYPQYLEQHRTGSQSVSDRPFLALLVLTTLLEMHEREGGAVHRNAITRALHLPRTTVQRLLHAQSATRLITQVQGEPGWYVPVEDMARVTTRQVLDRLHLLPGLPERPRWVRLPPNSPVQNLFAEANRGLWAPLDDLSVNELALRLADARASGHLAAQAADSDTQGDPVSAEMNEERSAERHTTAPGRRSAGD